jgi:hypothetical protein
MTAAVPFGYSYPNVAAFQTPIYGMEWFGVVAGCWPCWRFACAKG